MKLIRHQTSGGPAYAAIMPDGKLQEVAGNLETGFRLLERVVVPGKRLAPIVPINIIGIALNYRKHAEESGKGVPERPVWFMKPTGALQNPDDPIVLPSRAGSQKVDFEGELAVILGRSCKNVAKEDALSYVLGYTVANDVSARDWQYEWGGGQFCQAKSFDTFCPLGPALVTADELTNPDALHLTTTVNGSIMQDWSTGDMVFGVAALIAFLSRSRTLPPGTVILTGTPHGVGAARKPPIWLRASDIVTIDIQGIGSLSNTVEEERA